MTVADVMKLYKVSRQRVHELSLVRGVKGRKLGPIVVFTPEEVKKLKPGRRTGRPRKDKKS